MADLIPTTNVSNDVNFLIKLVFKHLYSAPQQPWANRGAFGSISPKKREVLRSDKEVERLDDKKETRADGGRRFQREGQQQKRI